jgi:hypothetical protein
VLLRALEVQQLDVLAKQAAAVDVLISPDVGAHGLFQFSKFAEVAEAGEAAAEEAVPALKALLDVGQAFQPDGDPASGWKA